MYHKEYKKCLDLITQYQELLIDKLLLLPPRLFLGISICLSGIYLMNKDLSKARKQLAPIIQNNAFASLKIFRAVQLLNLLIYYELGDMDYTEAVIRSIKRKNKKSHKETRVEQFLFRYLETDWQILPKEKSHRLKEKLKNDIIHTKYSIDGLQLIRFFDFTQWLLLKLK